MAANMSVLPVIPFDASAAEARALLEAAGWRLVGAGDWSWALADPSGAWAARITPFDPGYLMFARDCLSGAPNRWLPHLAEIVPLRREGYIVVMERLWPAPEPEASAFCAALGIANETNYTPPTPGRFEGEDHPDLSALRNRLQALIAQGRARHPFWVCDIREGNVMTTGSGALKLVDPMGIAGWKIVEALREGAVGRLEGLSRSQLEDFLTIPYFGPEREGHEQRDEILGWVARLDLPG